MKKVILYLRAFGLVMKRRSEKRKEQKAAQKRIAKEKNVTSWGKEEKKSVISPFYVVLGCIAGVAVCTSGYILYQTADHMETMHAAANPEETEEESGTAVEMPTIIEEVEPQEIMTEVTVEDVEIPLAAKLLDEEGFEQVQSQWQSVSTGIHVTASSVLQSETHKSYEPENLLDGDALTNWQEGEEDNGEGSTLTFTFEQPISLAGLEILNGNGASDEKYYADSRPKDITIQMGTKKVNFTCADRFGSQIINLEPHIETDTITLTIDTVYEGDKYEDTCISDIIFYTSN